MAILHHVVHIILPSGEVYTIWPSLRYALGYYLYAKCTHNVLLCAIHVQCFVYTCLVFVRCGWHVTYFKYRIRFNFHRVKILRFS